MRHDDHVLEEHGNDSKMLRRMLCLPREPEMNAGEYVEDANRTLKALRCKHNIVGWDQAAVTMHFAWAGHVSRFAEYDPNRITLKVLRYRDWEWLKTIADQNNGRQLHCRKLRVWRWESPLYRYAGCQGTDTWHKLAADKRAWNADLLNMGLWYLVNRR